MTTKHGDACIRCGGTLRYVRKNACVACTKARRSNPAHLARKRERAEQRRREDRDAVLAVKRAYRERMHERIREQRREAYVRMRERTQEQRQAEKRAKQAVRDAKREAKKAARIALTPEERKMRRQIHDRNKRSRTRAAIRGTSGRASNAAILALRHLQHGACNYCLAPVEHLDHKTPLARGGTHTISNLQWLCGACNMRKWAQTDEEYRARYGIRHAWPLLVV